MRRLKQHQRVEIHLDVGEEDEIVPCLVLGVEGSVATLASLDAAPVALAGNSTPAVPGYLVFDHGGRSVALKGIATTGANDHPALLFVVIDGVQLPERRSAERVEVDAVARLYLPGGAGGQQCVETPLADLSISGMRVQRHPALEADARYRLELCIGDQRPPIRCDAEVARTTPTHVGMKFVDLQDGDRALLAAIVASRRSYSQAA
jgi:hypothetical protein